MSNTPIEEPSSIIKLIIALIGILYKTLKYRYVPGYREEFEDQANFNKLIRESIQQEVAIVQQRKPLEEEQVVVREEIKSIDAQIVEYKEEIATTSPITERDVDTTTAISELTRIANKTK